MSNQRYTRKPISESVSYLCKNLLRQDAKTYVDGLNSVLKNTCHGFDDSGYVISTSRDIKLNISPFSENLAEATGRNGLYGLDFFWSIETDEYLSVYLELVFYVTNNQIWVLLDTSDSPANFEIHTTLKQFVKNPNSIGIVKDLISGSGWNSNQEELILKDIEKIIETFNNHSH